MLPTFQQITLAQCCDVAEEVRKKYWQSQSIPVDIDHIVTFGLRLSIIPMDHLRNDLDIYGFLSNDRSTIYVDSGIMIAPKFEAVLRFTMAHELGHYFLHREFYQDCKISSVNEWKNLMAGIDGANLSAYESQADEFAGRLLIPLERLQDELEGLSSSSSFKTFRSLIEQRHGKEETKRILPLYAADQLSSKFNVPLEVIHDRMKMEDISLDIFMA